MIKNVLKYFFICIAIVGLTIIALSKLDYLKAEEPPPPKGIIVANHCDSDNSRIGEYSCQVIASVHNVGSAGEITVTAAVKQDGYYYRKNSTKYIGADQIETFIVEFDEVEFLGGKIYSEVSCNP